MLDTIAECMEMPTEINACSASAEQKTTKTDDKKRSGMIAGCAAGTAALGAAALGMAKAGKDRQLPALHAAGAVTGAAAAALGCAAVWFAAARKRRE